MMSSWWAPAEAVSITAEIKKSRFITLLAPTNGVEAAKAFVQLCRQQHPAAVHHCWAYIAGAPDDSQQLGFSDDGEPSGTAGKPMLAQLTGSGLGEISAVVVRYYGGIQLGTGGLVKAYGGGVQQALKLVTPVERIPQTVRQLRCGYPQLPWVETVMNLVGGRIVTGEYGESIILTLSMPANRLAEADEKLRDLSRGALQFALVPQ